MLPLVRESSTSNVMSYLIQERHTSSRWPAPVFNASNEMNRNMYTELHQLCSYITLIAASCKDCVQTAFVFRKQLSTLSECKISESWNTNVSFVTQVIANCTHFDSENNPRSNLVIFALMKLLPSPLTLPFSDYHNISTTQCG